MSVACASLRPALARAKRRSRRHPPTRPCTDRTPSGDRRIAGGGHGHRQVFQWHPFLRYLARVTGPFFLWRLSCTRSAAPIARALAPVTRTGCAHKTNLSAALRSGRALRRHSTARHSPCPSRQARGNSALPPAPYSPGEEGKEILALPGVSRGGVSAFVLRRSARPLRSAAD